MNGSQIRWAEQHDWFVRAEFCFASRTFTVFAEDAGIPGCKAFTSYTELRAWAGY